MEETLIKVTDVKGTILKPIDATFKVEYKYEGEAVAEEVLSGDVRRGTVKGEKFPVPDATKDLEYSEVKIDVKGGVQNLNYASKTLKFFGKLPPLGLDTGLPFKGIIPKTKKEKQGAMADRRETLLSQLKEKYPPQKTK